MSTLEYIVFGTDDPSYVAVKAENNIFTGQNSFASNVSVTAPLYINTANIVSLASISSLTLSSLAQTSNASVAGSLYVNTVNIASTASICSQLDVNSINCQGYYQASGVTGYSGTIALALRS